MFNEGIQAPKKKTVNQEQKNIKAVNNGGITKTRSLDLKTSLIFFASEGITKK